ncbi:MAG: nucleotidyltransferase domain-containing protein [Lachnospiraceae bacterium]|nr:nucleotidyltransferase domain-containing protein [Lachnospiraceae bacterium]
MGELKELRIEKNMTQKEAAECLGVSLRSYKSYENEKEKRNTMKYKYMVEQLEKVDFIDEEHGVLTIESIRRKCDNVLSKYDVAFCYLFGSYAKGKETPVSDVDLLISADIKGLKFYGMVEELRTALRKRVEVLDMNQLRENPELTEEILKDGVKIYG